MEINTANRTNYSTGTPWEGKVGYSRAVKVGNIIEVSGTAPMKDGIPVYGSAYEQTVCCLETIAETLEQAGSGMEDVIRTRMYVTDISLWEEVAQAHGEFFQNIKPAATMVQVSALIDPQFVVEVEATAILPNGKTIPASQI